MPRPDIRGRAADPSLRRLPATQPAAGLKISTSRRSQRYLRALADCDLAGGHTELELQEAIAAVRQEFHEKWAQTPIGLLARCYLGFPYEVHMLALDGGIIEHFERHQALPAAMERARPYARTEQYAAIEVYPDRLICVRADGTTVTLEG